MSKFLNSKLNSLEAYVPGEQPQDKRYVKLNTNESPFPPSVKVLEAVNSGAVSRLRLYSDPECRVLRETIAERYGVQKENVFVSNGSDDILNFSFLAFGEKGVAYADITYGFYPVFTNLYGLTAEVVPLNQDFSLNVEAFKGRNKLVVIANPNAPTGMYVSLAEIEDIVTSNPNGVVIIDEAYVDFGGETAVSLTKKYDNLLVSKTFSKSRSLAGARLGYAIANEKLIEDLNLVKYSTNPYNVNSLTQIAGVKAMEDEEYFQANVEKIKTAREYTTTELEKLGFKVLPSRANFIFAESDSISGLDLYLKLKEEGVLIRHFEKARISNFNRITIGSIEEMQIFIEKVKKILGK